MTRLLRLVRLKLLCLEGHKVAAKVPFFYLARAVSLRMTNMELSNSQKPSDDESGVTGGIVGYRLSFKVCIVYLMDVYSLN